MSPQALFSVDPLNPSANTYDPANPTAPWGWGNLYSWGGKTYPSSIPLGELAHQHGNNEIIIGNDAVPPSTPLYPGLDSPWRHCAFYVSSGGKNVTTKNQYLYIFALRGDNGSPTAQFWVGNQEVDSELLTVGQNVEQHAILLDVPGDGHWVNIYIRLVSDKEWSAMGFRGMTCYLL